MTRESKHLKLNICQLFIIRVEHNGDTTVEHLTGTKRATCCLCRRQTLKQNTGRFSHSNKKIIIVLQLEIMLMFTSIETKLLKNINNIFKVTIYLTKYTQGFSFCLDLAVNICSHKHTLIRTISYNYLLSASIEQHWGRKKQMNTRLLSTRRHKFKPVIGDLPRPCI